MSAGHKKRIRAAGSRNTLPQYLPNPKNKFPVKCIFTSSIFVLHSTNKKAETTALEVFKIMDLEKLQQETTKGTLRP